MKKLLVLLLIASLSTFAAPSFGSGQNSLSSIDSSQSFAVYWGSGSGIAWPQLTRYPKDKDPNYTGLFVFPVCSSSLKNDCIISIEFQNPTGLWIKGNFVQYLPLSDHYVELAGNLVSKSAEPIHNFPASERSGIWQFPGLTHDGGSQFMFSSSMYGEFSNRTDPLATGSIFQFDGVGPFMSLDAVSVSTLPGGNNTDPNSWCTSGEPQLTCIKKFDLPANTPFRATLNFKYAKTFWNSYNWLLVAGSNPSISSLPNSDGTVNYQFTALPETRISPVSLIPKTQQGYDDLTAGFKAFLNEASPGQVFYNPWGDFAKWKDMNGNDSVDGEQPGAFSMWPLLEKYLAPQYFSETNSWGFRKAQPTGTDFTWVSQCGASGDISGFVATNASIAKPAPPHWNPETQTLDFKIASPHTNSDGVPTVGSYDLGLSTKVANCLWGTNVAGAKAEISIVDSSGSSTVTTSTLRNDKNYIYFDIAGFHYSTDTISIKLKFDSPVAPKPQAKKSTISCVKGKLMKKVTAVNPSCPSGYKLKSA